MTAPLTCDLPFRLRDRAGEVRVQVVANDDPEDLGHPLVAVGYDRAAFTGFPCVTASVVYDGSGPRAWMGWLQVVVRRDDDGAVTQEVDALPLLGDASPLYSFGYKPTFSDFPANPGHPDGDWIADAFLVAVPDVVRSRRLELVTGFRWGYRLEDGRAVGLFEPTPLDADAWLGHRGMLVEGYPAWEFLGA